MFHKGWLLCQMFESRRLYAMTRALQAGPVILSRKILHTFFCLFAFWVYHFAVEGAAISIQTNVSLYNQFNKTRACKKLWHLKGTYKFASVPLLKPKSEICSKYRRRRSEKCASKSCRRMLFVFLISIFLWLVHRANPPFSITLWLTTRVKEGTTVTSHDWRPSEAENQWFRFDFSSALLSLLLSRISEVRSSSALNFLLRTPCLTNWLWERRETSHTAGPKTSAKIFIKAYRVSICNTHQIAPFFTLDS